jgi:hypothetical protein
MSVRTKLLGVLSVSGVLSLALATPALAADNVTSGAATVASGTATSGTGTSGGGASGNQNGPANCSVAGVRLARLEKVQTRISTVLPKLEAAEAKAKSNGHPKVAARLAHRVSRLEKLQTRVSNRITRIEQRCPGVTPSSGGSSSPSSSS